VSLFENLIPKVANYEKVHRSLRVEKEVFQIPKLEPNCIKIIGSTRISE
jgi:hypothetical protein